LSAIFGAQAEEEEPPAEEAEEPEKPAEEETPADEPEAEETGPSDLSAIFGEQAREEEPPAEEPEKPAEEETPAEEPEQTEETPVEEPEQADEEEPAAEEPEQSEEAVEEPQKEEPQEPSVEAAKEPMPQASYEILPGDSSALCSLRIDSGSIRVLRSLVTAMSGEATLEGDILSGPGMAWMGQGSLTPVAVDYEDGMTVRIDRLAVRPAGVTSNPTGIETVPSLRKLEGEYGGTLLLFITGRQKKITVVPGLRVKAGSVLAASPEVIFSEEEDGFLSATGSGRVIITG